MRGISDAHPNRLYSRLRKRLPKLISKPRIVDRDRPGRPDHGRDERPHVVDRPLESADDELGKVFGGVGMRVAEFGDVVALAAVAEQGVRPGVMQLAVVEHDEARIAHQVGPHELVAGGVPQLIDHQIVGPRELPRHEVVRPPELDTGPA